MNVEQLKIFFRQPFDLIGWQQVLTENFGITQIRVVPKTIYSNDAKKVTGKELAVVDSESDGKKYRIGFYVFEVGNNTKVRLNRVGLRSLVQGYTRYEVDAAVTVYHDETHWRLSFVSDLNGEETAPKRYTYVFGDVRETYRTAAQRLAVLSGSPDFMKIREAFSVEAVGDEFFDAYKEIYASFVEYSTGKRMVWQENAWVEKEVSVPNANIMEAFQCFQNPEKALRDYVKKMMGRMVFLQFLQKKGWMGVPRHANGWQGGDPRYLQSLILSNKESNILLTDTIEFLFFKTLNEKRDNDLVHKKLGENLRVPYLNGGLFDKDESDSCNIDFPYSFFNRLAVFFDSYNFTVDENDPDDCEVGIDPEMLGRIFENLLEDNKDKGVFYTPKEIVQYMCAESLKKYLETHTESKFHSAIESLISRSIISESLQNKVMAQYIYDLLRRVKVCDPAIGSGAFPMGMLSLIYKCRRCLYGFLESFSPFMPAEIKRDIIQNNIYGVDIEQGAVDIARLRFWLALVVEEEIPQPLPNLDYKIMQGNSLLESFEGIDLSKIIVSKNNSSEKSDCKPETVEFDFINQIDSKIKARQSLVSLGRVTTEDISRMIMEYFSESNHEKKADLRNRIDMRVREHIEESVRINMVDIEAQLKDAREALVEAEQKWVPSKTGKVFRKVTKLGGMLQQFERAKEKLSCLKESSERPYFLWHLYFQDVFQAGGFDIVIGNPPYIQLEKNGGLLGDLYEASGFKTFKRSGDIYCLFFEKGCSLLSEYSVLCFITSNKWMRAEYGQPLRGFLSENTTPLRLIDFSGQKVFKTATVDANILLLQKGVKSEPVFACMVSECFGRSLSEFVRQKAIPLSFLTSDSWLILTPIEQSIKHKIETVGTPLKDWNIQINYGIKTGYNGDLKDGGCFIITESKRKEIMENCADRNERERTDELIRPILRGRDIKRYRYEYAGLYIIATFPVLNIDIEEYPAVKQHLLCFGRARLEQTGKKHKIDGNIITSRKRTNNKWFETQDSISYWEDFSKPKIIYPDIMRMPTQESELISYPYFCLDTNGFYVEATNFMITGKDIDTLYLFLLSDIGFYLFSRFYTGPQFDETGFRYKKIYLQNLFVPKVTPQLESSVKKLMNGILTNEIIVQINSLFETVIGLTDEERMVIRDYKKSLLANNDSK